MHRVSRRRPHSNRRATRVGGLGGGGGGRRFAIDVKHCILYSARRKDVYSARPDVTRRNKPINPRAATRRVNGFILTEIRAVSSKYILRTVILRHYRPVFRFACAHGVYTQTPNLAANNHFNQTKMTNQSSDESQSVTTDRAKAAPCVKY